MRAYLVRHGTTRWNSEERWQGQTDLDLLEKGRRDARKIGRILQRLIHGKVSLYASDLKRASETAEIIGRELDLIPVLRTELREGRFDLWNGMTFKDIEEHCLKEFLLWISTPDARISGTESLKMVQERAFSAFQEIVDREDKEGSVVLVSHALWIKVLICKLLETEPTNYFKIALDNCSIAVLELNERGYWRVQHLNLSSALLDSSGGHS